MQTDLYDVTLLGFPGSTPTGEPPAAALARIFPVDPTTARRFVDSAPVTVKHGAPARLARRYRQCLEAIGAEVAVQLTTPLPQRPSPLPTPAGHGGHAGRPTPSTPATAALDGVGVTTPLPTPSPSRRQRRATPQRAPKTPSRGRPTTGAETESGFFESVPGSLLVPFRGDGKGWLLAALGAGTVSIFAGFIPFYGWIIQLFFFAGLVTLCSRYFQTCLGTTSVDEDRPAGLPDLTHFSTDLALPGVALTAWLIVAHLPLILWINSQTGVSQQALVFDPLTLVLVALPGVLWPMALAHEATTDSLFSMWNLPRLLVSIVRSPVRYAVVLVVGAISTILPLAVLSLAAAGAGPFVAFLVVILTSAAMAYGHGVMGSLMGHLARTKPEVLPIA